MTSLEMLRNPPWMRGNPGFLQNVGPISTGLHPALVFNCSCKPLVSSNRSEKVRWHSDCSFVWPKLTAFRVEADWRHSRPCAQKKAPKGAEPPVECKRFRWEGRVTEAGPVYERFRIGKGACAGLQSFSTSPGLHGS